MCGLLGVILKNKKLFNKQKLLRSLHFLNNRGPDFQNYEEYENNNNKYFFGHTRLSIIDTSASGNQPMFSKSRRYLILFNGEIYNHLKLRNLINKKINIKWKSNSDTETLINYIENFEINEVLNNLSGMFAFSVYDFKEDKLTLARDIAGEKPLYISFNNEYLVYTSDLSTINNLNFCEKNINDISVQNYLKYNYIPSPDTIYKNTFKLESSSLLEIDFKKFKLKKIENYSNLNNEIGIRKYKWWALKKNQLNIDRNEINSEIEKKIEIATKEQLISDVPIGVFLSGGVDSSLVLSQVIKNISKVDTFNIGFDFKQYDESEDALKISKIFGTKHNHYVCTKKDAINMIHNINDAFSEPFADASQIPTMLVSSIARQKVKVILGGDGGDELFGGYNRYLLANKYWKYLKLFPKPFNKIFLLHKFLPKKLIFNFFDTILSLENFSKNKHSSYHKILKKIENIHNRESFYESLTIEWNEDTIINSNVNLKKLSKNNILDKNLTFEESMMKKDFETYLADDILCKVDRASMFFSLEARSPLLNRQLIEFIFNLPLDYKIKNNITKLSSKKILEKYLPKELIYKSKQGFGVPLAEWFRNDLKDYVFDNLSEINCKKHNLFNYGVIKNTLDDHFKKNINSEHKLWSLIQFNSWYSKHFN